MSNTNEKNELKSDRFVLVSLDVRKPKTIQDCAP